MKKLFTSALLTVTAVPFLIAAPNAGKKAQNTAAPAASTKKAHKKHSKKSNKTPKDTAAPSANKK